MSKKTFGEMLLTVLGDIKIFSWPMFILYDPGSYLIKGKEMREIINLVKPGDILLRGYKNYLDGYFIPGFFSHAGLYVGEVLKEDIQYVQLEDGKKIFSTGKQMVIHSMAEGVFIEDVLNFCRCDYMAILRIPEQVGGVSPTIKELVGRDIFTAEEILIADRLQRGEQLSREDLFPVVYRSALGSLGKDYDFNFDFENFHTLSCSELIYYCMKSFCSYLDVHTNEKQVLLFLKKTLLEPDALLRSKINLLWHSESVKEEDIKRVRNGK